MGILKDKVAVITGGCSGLGLGAVELFVSEGARVIVADVQADKGLDIENRLGAAVRYRRCDVTVEAEIAGAIEEAVQAFGGLDIMLNNAGARGSPLRIDQMTAEDWDLTQALLVRSAVLGLRHAAGPMKARGGGSVINTASVAGLQAGAGPIGYSVAKAAVLHLTKVAAAELGRDRIRVNAILPGFIPTNIIPASLGLGDADAEAVRRGMASFAPRVQPIPRMGVPEDFARAALFLASDGASFISGAQILLDGGMMTGQPHAWSENATDPFEMIAQNAVAFAKHSR